MLAAIFKARRTTAWLTSSMLSLQRPDRLKDRLLTCKFRKFDSESCGVLKMQECSVLFMNAIYRIGLYFG